MGRKTNISYATATWSGWRGCTHAGVGCDNCFAEAQAKRNPTVLGQWGPHGTRVVAAPQYWKQPLKWDRDAMCDGGDCDPESGRHSKGCPQHDRPRVLWDLSDVFEDWTGAMLDHTGKVIVNPEQPHLHKTMGMVRRDAFNLIDQTPNLCWLLLTKRPQNIRSMWSAYSGAAPYKFAAVTRRENVWLGCSCSTQHDLDQMVPHLLGCRDLSPVLWLSLEPLLGPIDLRGKLGHWTNADGTGSWFSPVPGKVWRQLISWVVVGGESGSNARPCNAEWIRGIAWQCKEAGVPCYVKQMGSRPVLTDPFRGAPGSVRLDTYDMPGGEPDDIVRPILLSDRKGGNPDEWFEELRVRQFPNVNR